MTSTKIEKTVHVQLAFNKAKPVGKFAKFTPTAKIQFQGNWLTKLGFQIGDALTIIATDSVIKIIKIKQ